MKSTTLEGFSSERLARIVPGMHRFIERDAMTGFTVAVSRHGKTVLFDMDGEMDREEHRPMQRDTIFQIMSMTKPVTSVAAMMLYEEGHFTLNTPVTEFIPGFGEKGVVPKGWAGNGVPRADELERLVRPVTMRHLFTHSSGISYGGNPDDPVDRAYLQATEALGKSRESATCEDLVNTIAALPLAFQPGTKWRYSFAIDVIGRIVEIISGMPLDRFFQERLFGPLGMVDTDFSVPKEKLDRLASVYSHDRKNPGPLALQESGRTSQRVNRPAFLSGGGGLVSTTSDYLRFASMLACGGSIDGVRILSPKTVELFTLNQLPPEALPYGFAVGEDLYHRGYGYSCGTRVLMDVGASGQAGNVGEFGWDGAFNTYFWVDRTLELTAVFMTQHSPNNYHSMADAFKSLVYAGLEE